MRPWWFAILFLGLVTLAVAQEAYFLTDPTLTPDGSQIIFSYEGDLWRVSAAGGTAVRLTGMEGNESLPRVSPDGRWLAFTGEQDGNQNVYLMPLEGGRITQLTFHDGFDRVESWSWDSRYIYFVSNRYNRFTTYRVSREGGTPQRLFPNYFNTIHNLVEDPNSPAVYFNESWESFLFVNRKRYKGEFNPDIKEYNPATGEFKVLTHYRGKDFWPITDRQGHLYFLSDEANNEYNLYTFREGKKVPLTHFATSIWKPQVSANGAKIVFEKDYQIYLYEVASGKTHKVPIVVYRNNTLTLEQEFNVKGKISAFEVSPDGKKLAFVSRGELFVSDVEGKFIKQMPTNPRERVVEVRWLQDNKTLLFSQTTRGWLNWFTIAADGKSPEKQITFDEQNNRYLSFNSDRSQAVYLSGRNEVRLLDLQSLKSETIVREELWGYYNAVPRFSPDDRYIAFTAYRNFEEDIFLYDTRTGKTVNLTNTGVTETNPYWSPDGKYLYFASDRHHPQFPRGSKGVKIYRLALEKFDAPFKSDRFDSLFVKKKKAQEEKEKKGSEKKKSSPKPVVTIDLANIWERVEQVSPDPGLQIQPYVLQEGEKTTVLYLSNHDGQSFAIWKTVYQPFEKPKTEKIKDSETNDLLLSRADSKLYVLVKGNIAKLDLKANKLEKIKTDYPFRRNLRDEFQQMFYETWANLQENYYDEHFHGVDWKQIKARYERYLPYLNSRANLRRLLNDMLGELNSSHLGFRSSGKEEKTFYKRQTMAIGALFRKSEPYVVERIVKKGPLDRVGKRVRSGDRLVAVNGVAVDPARNREVYFVAPERAPELTLTFQREAKRFTVKVHPVSSRELSRLLYDEWEAERQRRVDEQSHRKIAYIHMKDMGGSSLNKFLEEMVSEAIHRQALILDLRYNTGGNVHDEVLRFLSQRPYLQWKYRGGSFAPQPNFAPAAHPIVLLVNAQSLSDAEMTTAGFKALKLGTIIGTETYRWIIFTSGKRLVDGSWYRLPSWGCYTLTGEDLERTGVKPDIYVKNTFKDRLEGRDPQLDRAVEEILKKIE